MYLWFFSSEFEHTKKLTHNSKSQKEMIFFLKIILRIFSSSSLFKLKPPARILNTVGKVGTNKIENFSFRLYQFSRSSLSTVADVTIKYVWSQEENLNLWILKWSEDWKYKLLPVSLESACSTEWECENIVNCVDSRRKSEKENWNLFDFKIYDKSSHISHCESVARDNGYQNWPLRTRRPSLKILNRWTLNLSFNRRKK